MRLQDGRYRPYPATYRHIVRADSFQALRNNKRRQNRSHYRQQQAAAPQRLISRQHLPVACNSKVPEYARHRDLSDEFKAFTANPGQFLISDTSLVLKPEFAGTNPIAPATHPFRGTLYVLTNGGTFSASSYVVNYLYRQRQGGGKVVFVGEENGGDVYSDVLYAGQSYRVELPNSHIGLDFPLLCGGQLDRNPPARRLPDFYVQPTGEQLAKGEDAEVRFVLRYVLQHLNGTK